MKKVEYAELATKKQFKKNLISTKIVEEMTTQNKNGSHLVLDSITLGSSKVYSENNISPVLIYIPQMIYSEYVEMFQSDGRCRIYHSTANRLLTSFKNKKKYFETIYLDYCCSPLGNKHMNPLDDLKLSLGVLNSNGILTWTFSTRSHKSGLNYTYEPLDTIRRELDDYAQSINCNLRYLFSFPYKSGKKNTGQTMYVTSVRKEQMGNTTIKPVVKKQIKPKQTITADIDRILFLRNGGYSIPHIATGMNLSNSNVRNILKRNSKRIIHYNLSSLRKKKLAWRC